MEARKKDCRSGFNTVNTIQSLKSQIFEGSARMSVLLSFCLANECARESALHRISPYQMFLGVLLFSDGCTACIYLGRNFETESNDFNDK